MNIKKILLIFMCLFVLSGCKIESISDNDVSKNVDLIFSKRIKYSNKDAIGYQYYLPYYMTVKNTNDFNQEIYYNGKTFYLYADVVSYYHKVKNDYKIDKNAYISKKLKYNNKIGYLEVNKDEKSGNYFIEMMYNYAKIEGYSSKADLVDSISSISYVLSSIKYNDNVVETLLGDKKYDLSGNETYNIFKSKKSNDGNFLDYVNEYDNYKGTVDDVNSLIEKQEIESTEKED
ncbi:MAG: hypothetical protein J6O62_03745 [Bacilli bacterium]|nr:hypothetical protein [Bacilli bacterium]MBO6194826.1 hypothetical protein [Bacilli bacterium]